MNSNREQDAVVGEFFKTCAGCSNVGADLFFPNFTCDGNSRLSRLIGLSSEAQRPHQKASANPNKTDAQRRDPKQPPRSLFYRLGGAVHALLGYKVALLQLAVYGFAALAGFGGFLAFDDLNGERKRLGLITLFGGASLSSLSFTMLIAGMLASRG
ncbi:hypothetical protein CKO19_03485 [Rhodovulum adriaticum]|nr:hypothetical protein [Rhodovulum adriaticum]